MWNHAGGAFGDAAVHSASPMPASAPAPSGFGEKGHRIAHLVAVYWYLRHPAGVPFSVSGWPWSDFELARQLHKPGEVR